MGYSTSFKGELKFTSELKASQLAELSKMLGEDCRDHPEWERTDLTYIDLELMEDFSGLKWNGAEKTYDMEVKIKLIIDVMRQEWPEFALIGSFLCQGDDVGDVYYIDVDGSTVTIRDILPEVTCCPHCGEEIK